MRSSISRLALAGATLLAAGTLATGAKAAVISDNFDADPVAVPVVGGEILNWIVDSGTGSPVGGIDVVANNTFSIFCRGMSGHCVDLDGTPGPGRITSKDSVSFGAGELVTLSFFVSGSQRTSGAEELYAGFFLDAFHVVTRSGGGVFSGVLAGNVNGFGFVAPVSGDDFLLATISFTSATAGSARAFIGTTSADNVGPVIDDVSFGTAAVPEPGTWAMMLLGFGGMGALLRRRRAAAYA